MIRQYAPNVGGRRKTKLAAARRAKALADQRRRQKRTDEEDMLIELLTRPENKARYRNVGRTEEQRTENRNRLIREAMANKEGQKFLLKYLPAAERKKLRDKGAEGVDYVILGAKYYLHRERGYPQPEPVTPKYGGPVSAAERGAGGIPAARMNGRGRDEWQI